MSAKHRGWRRLQAPATETGDDDMMVVDSLETLDVPYTIVNGQVVLQSGSGNNGADEEENDDEEGAAKDKCGRKKKQQPRLKRASAGSSVDAMQAGDKEEDWEEPDFGGNGNIVEPNFSDEDDDEDVRAPVQQQQSAHSEDAKGGAESPRIKANPSSATSPLEKDDGDAPLVPSAWDEFAGLHPSLIRGLLEMKFTTPTPIQRICIPALLVRGKDVLGEAETGSGKTLAYGLPILSGLLNEPPERDDGLAALVLAPTRELAMQVVEHFRRVLEREPLATRPRVEALVGGMSVEKQERVLDRKPGVVVATVGRLMAMVDARHEHVDRLAQSLRFLVLDEADRMCDSGHYMDLAPLVELLTRVPHASSNDAEKDDDVKPKRRQTMLFSATLSHAAVAAQRRANDLALATKKQEKKAKRAGFISGPVDLMAALGVRGKPETHSVLLPEPSSSSSSSSHAPPQGAATQKSTSRSVAVPETLGFSRIDCGDEDRDSFLYYFLLQRTAGSVLVFVNTITAARRLAEILKLLLPPAPQATVGMLHANMGQKQRLTHLDRFRAEACALRVLVATDVAARGLDIPDVDVVVHFGMPPSPEIFIHRSGRTARAGRKGHVLCIVGGTDDKTFARMRKAVGREIPWHRPIESRTYQMALGRARIARRLQRMESQRSGEQVEKKWRQRMARDIGVELSDDDGDDDSDDEKPAGGGKRKSRAKSSESRGSVNQALARHRREAEEASVTREIGALRRELATRLMEDLLPRGRSSVVVANASTAQVSPDAMLQHARTMQPEGEQTQHVSEAQKRKRQRRQVERAERKKKRTKNGAQ